MDVPTTHGGGYLHTEALERAGKRLSIVALVVAGGYVVMTSLYLTVFAHVANRTAQLIAAITVVVSLWIAWHVRGERCNPVQAMHLGLAYEVLLCFGFFVSDLVLIPPTGVPSLVSWSCTVIIFFPALVPTTPRMALVTSLAASATALAAYPLAQSIRQVPIAEPTVLTGLLIPAVMCSFMAYVSARVLQSLGKDVKNARQLGSYQLVEQLGEGGMGEVWRARHRLLARPAAIKLVRGEGTQTDVAMQRFEREAQITAALESAHTVELYDFGVASDGAFYYVMELLRGIDLERLVSRFGPLPPARVVHLLEQACHSLDDAHYHELVHRDIKPANLFLCKRGRQHDFLKVLDFGLVQMQQPEQDARATADGAVLGTPAYLAPEMATGEHEVEARSDIYALGCVAYYLLTGELVFDAATPMKVAIAHATAKPVPPSKRSGDDIPEALERIVMACLQKDPEDRPDSAFALAKQLRACQLDDSWNEELAEAWWQEHLGDLLTKGDSIMPGTERPTAILQPLA